MSSQSSQALLNAARNSPEQVLADLESSLSGLTASKAKELLKRYGLNQVARKKPAPWWLQLLKTFNSPFNYLLLLLGLVSFVSGNAASAVMIAVMVLLSALLRFAQEFRSSKAAEELRSLISNRISVCRDGQPTELPIENLVPGDIIQLSAGDLIPADIRLLEAKGLHVNQSALSGESFPVAKTTHLDNESSPAPLDCANLCFMGTSVLNGTGKAVVLFTGDQTYFGNLATKIVDDEPPTDFENGINALSWLLIRFILGMVTVILLINGLSKGDWLLSFLFALSVGVGLTPELLPMIITTNLSRGAIVLSGKKVIVKRLSAIQNLGAIDILCTDKTGTLTQNKVIVYQHLDLHGQISLEVLKYAYLNSHFQTGLKNLLDEAILEHAEQDDGLRIEANYQKLDEIPFDFERRRLSVIIRETEGPVLICKGAVEETLAVCNRIQDKGHEYPMTREITNKVVEQAKALNQQGFRVVAIAYKQTPDQLTSFSASDEADLILLGYIAFLDPPQGNDRRSHQRA